MHNEKEKEINFKPSNWLYIFLFIYYSVWLLQSIWAISHYIRFGFDSFLAYGLVDWMCFALFIVAGVYSFYAVIKTLRGDKDCITSLKWSLVFVFLYTLMNPTRGQIPTYNILTWYIEFLVRPLFYLIFYLYLCFAKGIKRRFPNAERKFAPSGWVWSGLVIAYASVGIYGSWQQYQISKYCSSVNVETLNLKPGEVSDGYVFFSSDRQWVAWTEPSDTLYIEDRLETLPTIMLVDSLSQIYLASGRCDKPDARTYNRVIVASLGIISANTNGKWGEPREVSFTDTIVSGKRLFSTVYQTAVDSIPAYFDVIMVVEANSPKCCVVVRVDREPIGSGWAVNFADGLKFDLQNVNKSEDNEDGDNAKNKDPHRTAKCNQQTNANMFASLFDRVSPRHLFSIVTLQYNEREITYRKCDHVFYNF